MVWPQASFLSSSYSRVDLGIREMVSVKSCQQRKSKLFPISACSHICIAEPALTSTTSVTAALEIQWLDGSVKLLHFREVAEYLL